MVLLWDDLKQSSPEASQLPRGSLSGCHPSASPIPSLPLPGGDRAPSWEMREHSWVTSPGMQAGGGGGELCRGPEVAKIRCHRSNWPVHFIIVGETVWSCRGTEEFAEIAEKIVSATMRLGANSLLAGPLATPQCLQLLLSKATLVSAIAPSPKHCGHLGHVTQPF